MTKGADSAPTPVPGRTVIATGAAAFALTAIILAFVQARVPFDALITERLFPGGGWILVAVLPAWAAWLSGTMLDPGRQAAWRRRAWLVFSVAFFAQLGLGLAGLDRFLMTGELHLPVPALILAGPLYRGQGLFMPILFVSTVVLVGPAWCSHLCYVGAWDATAASRMRKATSLPRWAWWARAGILAAVIVTAVTLNMAQASAEVAGAIALGFGLFGVAVILVASRRMGVMVHCLVVCPVGLVADALGKISPWRIRIGEGCTRCGACTTICRYDALRPVHIEEKKPGIGCTLCGDCVGACKHDAIGYRLLGLAPDVARAAFIALVTSLHASFLGIARI